MLGNSKAGAGCGTGIDESDLLLPRSCWHQPEVGPQNLRHRGPKYRSVIWDIFGSGAQIQNLSGLWRIFFAETAGASAPSGGWSQTLQPATHPLRRRKPTLHSLIIQDAVSFKIDIHCQLFKSGQSTLDSQVNATTLNASNRLRKFLNSGWRELGRREEGYRGL